eukprot:SAG25_NODE_767_length_5466_cov_4.881871_3_plen_70_part_00
MLQQALLPVCHERFSQNFFSGKNFSGGVLRAGLGLPWYNKQLWCGESQFFIYHTKWEAHVRMVTAVDEL